MGIKGAAGQECPGALTLHQEWMKGRMGEREKETGRERKRKRQGGREKAICFPVVVVLFGEEQAKVSVVAHKSFFSALLRDAITHY